MYISLMFALISYALDRARVQHGGGRGGRDVGLCDGVRLDPLSDDVVQERARGVRFDGAGERMRARSLEAGIQERIPT
jgi:hypothetical protein